MDATDRYGTRAEQCAVQPPGGCVFLVRTEEMQRCGSDGAKIATSSSSSLFAGKAKKLDDVKWLSGYFALGEGKQGSVERGEGGKVGWHYVQMSS